MTKGTMLSPSSRSPNGDHAAFEARVVAAAELRPGVKGSAKTALAGADDLCAAITDDEYRHHLQDLFEALARVDGLTVFWGPPAAHFEWPYRQGSPVHRLDISTWTAPVDGPH